MAFVVIEGLDGAGKSTQLELLRQAYDRAGTKHRFVHFPRTSSPVFGDMVARFLRGDLGRIDQVDPYLVALLYAGDRNDFKGELLQWIGEGSAILMDRYVYSNIAFQCAKVEGEKQRDELARWIEKTEYGYFGIPRPDVSIFLDVPEEFTRKKLKTNRQGNDRGYLQGKQDIHEKDMDFQARVRDVYLNHCQSKKDLLRIDCSTADGQMLAPEAIAQKIYTILKEKNCL